MGLWGEGEGRAGEQDKELHKRGQSLICSIGRTKTKYTLALIARSAADHKNDALRPHPARRPISLQQTELVMGEYTMYADDSGTVNCGRILYSSPRPHIPTRFLYLLSLRSLTPFPHFREGRDTFCSRAFLGLGQENKVKYARHVGGVYLGDK